MARHHLYFAFLTTIVLIVLNFWLFGDVETNALLLSHFATIVRRFPLEQNVSRNVTKDVSNDRRDDSKRHSNDESLWLIPKYSIDSIARTLKALVYIPGNLLIYNPVDDTILVYAVSHSEMQPTGFCRRCRTYVPMLAQSLWKNPRVTPDQGPLQLFFSEADFPYIDMQLLGTRNATKTEEGTGFCPWVQFGSVLRNSTILPTVHAFPFDNFLWCVAEWYGDQLSQTAPVAVTNDGNTSHPPERICRRWRIPFREDLSWGELIPQLVWRGHDYAFLHTLRHEDFQSPYSVTEVPFFPRRLVTNRTNSGETWINAAFPNLSNGKKMSPKELSRYKYHIDLAGAGGTTWTGTLEKLAMPGLLFHHETPAKDFYYDSLKPWYHYVPIRTDLSDLKERYRWAEENQEEARAIAERGTAFAKSFFSYSNLQKIHEKYFGESGVLSKIVDAYEDRENATLESILSEYQEKWNMTLNLVSICSRQHCDTLFTYGKFWRASLESDSCQAPSARMEKFGKHMYRCVG